MSLDPGIKYIKLNDSHRDLPIICFPEHGDHKPRSSRSAEGSKVPSETRGASWEPTECLSWEVAKTEFECNYGDWMKSLKLPYINV